MNNLLDLLPFLHREKKSGEKKCFRVTIKKSIKFFNYLLQQKLHLATSALLVFQLYFTRLSCKLMIDDSFELSEKFFLDRFLAGSYVQHPLDVISGISEWSINGFRVHFLFKTIKEKETTKFCQKINFTIVI